MFVIFVKVIQEKPKFINNLTHKLKHFPNQIESVAIVKYYFGEVYYV